MPARRSKAKPPSRSQPRLPIDALGSFGVLLFTGILYWTLTRYYFAQDDFVFLERASLGLRQALAPHFTLHPGHFRPITKGLYFAGMWHAFGLNPFPYHAVSLVLHAINSILVGTLLRRMGVSRPASWAGAFLFAANMAFLATVAWISCIQQVLGTLFALVAMIFGIDAMSSTGRNVSFMAVAAYALALGSYEQTLAVPLVLALWRVQRDGWRVVRSAWRGTLGAMLVVFVAYIVYVFVLRGLPAGGPYRMSVGSNVLENLRAYSGSIFALWMTYPVFALPPGFTASHAVWLALALLHLVRRQVRPLAFGCATFLLFLAPVVCMTGHVEAHHMYLPAIGAWYVLASGVDLLHAMLAPAWRRRWSLLLAALTVVVLIGSMAAVDRNEHTIVGSYLPLPRLFVFRRAMVAENVCRGVVSKWPGGSHLLLVYGGSRETVNGSNVQSAIAEGSAIRVVLRRPDLDVVFAPPAVLHAPPDPDHVVMVIDVMGGVHTAREWLTLEGNQPNTTRSQ